ncbi:MAG: LamG-like jellyroll fold domain-containing protein [Verrucomicrobiota bacterium]
MKKLPHLLLSLSLLPAAAQDVRLGLVSYWPLDELSGDSLTTPDKAGFASDLTLVNMDASNVTAGKRGNAMTFDGINELLWVSTGAGANPGLPLQANVQKTICMWVKTDGAAFHDKRIFSEASMDSNNPMFNLGTDNATTGSTGKIDIYIRADDGAATVGHIKSTGSPFDNTWHHVALTDNNGTIRYYVDGVLDAAVPAAYTRPVMTLNTLSLGGIKRLGGELAQFTGALDDVAVWKRILTPAEIQNVMANGLSTPVPRLIYADRLGPYIQGDRVRFSVEIKGEEPTSWQWRRNGTAIPGATESTYTVPALTADTQGDYTVLLNGSVVSSTIPLTFTPDPAAAVATNIVSWWPFNTLDENPVPPVTPDPWGGNPLSCTDIEGANLVPGKFGNAMSFDGVSEIAARTSGFPIASNSEYSVAFWVKADGATQSDLRVFAEGSNTSQNPLFAMGTVTDSSSHLRMFVRNDTGGVLVNKDSESAVMDDTWHHVVWTDRNGRTRLYVDGFLDGANFDYNRTGQVLTLNQTSVGAIQRAAPSHWCRSTMDDVAVWNRALTWTEVQSLMTAGVPAPVTAVPPDVTVQPVGGTLWSGRAITLSIQATGTGPFTYTWLKDGTPVPGAAEATLVLDPAAAADTGTYTCKVLNTVGSDTSASAVVTVKAIAGLETGHLSSWALDGGTTTTPDSISALDLTLGNLDPLTAFQPGLKNNALLFDGADDLAVHAYTGTGQDLPLTTRQEFTIAMWVRGSGVGQLDRRVFSEGSTTGNNQLFNLGTDNAGLTDQLEIFIRGDSGGIPVDHKFSNVPVFDGYWHHVIYTDYKGQGQLYVDGLPDLQMTYTRPVSTFTNVSIGGISRAAPTHWFAGGIDEVNTWERGLSADEATQLFQSYPKPASVFTITGVTSPAAGQIQLTVATSLGNNAAYRVDSSPSLLLNSWIPVNDATVNPVVNGLFTVDIPVSAASTRLFYRVVVP